MRQERNKYRIIGGQWRGRVLRFPDAEGLRPTGDRLRETLFNWLQGPITGAHCLDAFAGSGALSFEALSRGAASVTALEAAAPVAAALGANARLLGTDQLRVERADALAWLARPGDRRFDVVFLDPPFALDCIAECCRLLDQGGWLADDARVYLESGRPLADLTLPAGWSLVREKHAGQVYYGLCVAAREDGAGDAGGTDRSHAP